MDGKRTDRRRQTYVKETRYARKEILIRFVKVNTSRFLRDAFKTCFLEDFKFVVSSWFAAVQ